MAGAVGSPSGGPGCDPAAGGNWIELRLRRRSDARGRPAGTIETTEVTLRVPDAMLRRSVDSVSYLSQGSRTLHFGMGAAERAEDARSSRVYLTYQLPRSVASRPRTS